jgi:hypothetical protein
MKLPAASRSAKVFSFSGTGVSFGMSFERLSEPGQRAKYVKIINCRPESPLRSRRLRHGSIRASTGGSLLRPVHALASRVLYPRSKFYRNSESLADQRALDEGDVKFAAFVKHRVGGKAGQEVKTLAGLNFPLVVDAKMFNRAEPDESNARSWPAQPLPVRNAAWQTSTRAPAPQQPLAIRSSRFSFHQTLDSNRPDAVKVRRQCWEANAVAGAGTPQRETELYKPSLRRHARCEAKFTSPYRRSGRPRWATSTGKLV